jgi:hypothetical protein
LRLPTSQLPTERGNFLEREARACAIRRGLSFFASKSKSKPDSDPDFDFDRPTILKLPTGYSTSGCAEKAGNQRLTASLRTLRTGLLCAREGIPFDTPPDAGFFSGINFQPFFGPPPLSFLKNRLS